MFVLFLCIVSPVITNFQLTIEVTFFIHSLVPFIVFVKNAKELDLKISNSEKFQQYIRSLRDIYKKQGYALPLDDYLHRAMRKGFSQDTEQSPHPMALPASCKPQSSVVNIELERELGPGEYLYPSCTRLQRCSGCCSHPLLSCQPTLTNILQLDVIYVNTLNNTDRIVTVNMTEHKSCECGCKVQREDCSPLQVYYPDQCLCQCSNWLERDLCGIYGLNKLWDESSCSCRCAWETPTDCPTGTSFSSSSCRSLQIDMIPPDTLSRCEDYTTLQSDE